MSAWPMATAPKDGTILRLLVQFEDHSFEDSNDPCWTIGFNNLANTMEDEWQFAGWCWSHDVFTQGTGKPIGWLPMYDTPADLAAARAEGAEAMKAACAGIAQGWLAQHGATNPEHISAQVWACDAVTDIIDGIRALPIPAADALARRDAEKVREGMQLAANLCRSKSMSNAAIGAMSDATEAEELAEEIEAAIRARAGGEERQG